MTDPSWRCTDCKYEGAPRETCTCPRCNGKMSTAEEREAVARKAATADASYRCSKEPMLNLLDLVLAELPDLLASPDDWRGMRIAYHPPQVDRAWRPWRDCRLSIHRIHPCAPGTALLHPHPWPSAMRVLAGRYAMVLGYGAGLATPPIAAEFVLPAGATYTMTDPDTWHDVRPLDAPVLTVMLSGPPWGRAMPVEPGGPQPPLTSEELAVLLAEARDAIGTRKEHA